MQEAITLYELNGMVRSCIEHSLSDEYWVKAELSDVRINASGHCYMELLQKDTRGNQLIARARGMIWNSTFRILRPYFEQATGQAFASGIKVLVKVTVQFHELYGHSLTIHDIDPTFTLGDLALRRKEILRQLEEEGVLTLNKELKMPLIPRRIAVISSATAAGYGDFCNQLNSNPYGFSFQVELFQAFMQGNQLEESVLNALDRIYNRAEHFDVVVIIRGGGATADLSGFDSYILAASCAQFPLPLITGIGHERDDTVIDAVAHSRVKTPTAAAELLIGRMLEQQHKLDELSHSIAAGARNQLEQAKQQLDRYCMQIPASVRRHLEQEKNLLQRLQMQIPAMVRNRLQLERHRVERARIQIPALSIRRTSMEQAHVKSLTDRIRQGALHQLTRERHRMELIGQRILDASPEKVLARGYSIVWHQGKIVKNAQQIAPGAQVRIKMFQGEMQATIEKTTDTETHK